MLNASEAAGIPGNHLIAKPFFLPFQESDLHDAAIGENTPGSNKAQISKVQYDLLGSGLPAMSYAIAANPLPAMAGNINMQELKTDAGQWPTENHSGDSANSFLHSDIREVAMPFLYRVYENMINTGTLNQ